MTKDQEIHLDNILNEFSILATTKYVKGQKEHGGNLWKKKHLIDMAIDEAIDQVIYLLTLKLQMQRAGIELGTTNEKTTI